MTACTNLQEGKRKRWEDWALGGDGEKLTSRCFRTDLPALVVQLSQDKVSCAFCFAQLRLGESGGYCGQHTAVGKQMVKIFAYRKVALSGIQIW